MNKEETLLEPSARLGRAKHARRQQAAARAEEQQKLMKAVTINRFGPPSVLTLQSLPRPEPGPREVLIALHAAGIGVWDATIRGGWWPEGRPKFPVVLGSDGAGIVEATGSLVRRFHEGDRVWAYEFINPKGGFYAQYIVVNADHVAWVPKHLELLHAGASAVTALTALQGIDDHFARACGRNAVGLRGHRCGGLRSGVVRQVAGCQSDRHSHWC